MIRPTALVLGLAALAGGPTAATAQEPGAVVSQRDARQAELDALTREITLTGERQEELRREIDAIEKDRASLNDALIDTTRRVQALEAELDRAGQRLESLGGEEDRLRQSLRSRRAVLAEVLAALQRMGRTPPPALLVRPEDALGAVRSAILMGAVVPDLREQAAALADDLQVLLALRADQARERDRLRGDALRLAEEGERLELLIAEKQRAGTRSAAALRQEQERAARLASQAASLKELIGRVETEIETAAAAAAAAAAADRQRSEQAEPVAPLALGDSDRIRPAIAFSHARGLLPRPVNGQEVRGFGVADEFGGTAQGVSFTTRAGARVATPADGWVVFAGPFRSYGNLLIINAGDGYHVLLAGMDRIDVELGQFVLAGEPVAAMGARRLASAGAVDIGTVQPVLYVEFRKDGTAVDPGPWWARPNDEKVGG